MFKTHFVLTSIVLAAGCAEPARTGSGYGLLDASDRVIEGSPEALGMLAFLNDASTTEELLDDVVRLDLRAARAIIDERNGPDDVYGTYDDQPFATVQEVDACYYVGATALGLIEQYAFDTGWVALDADDILGTWDDVTFTVAQAEAVVELANRADPVVLDDDLGLDGRAVNSIVQARPIESVLELSELYYVGQSALSILLEAAMAQSSDGPDWDSDNL